MALTSGQNVKVSVEDRVVLVTIDHRPVNALDRLTLQELGQAIDAIQTDAGVKVVVITGGGSLAFVAGADIKEVAQMGSADDAKQMARRVAREEALFAGTSSGANITAAIQIGKRLGANAKVVTLMVDSGLKYAGTDLYQTKQSL